MTPGWRRPAALAIAAAGAWPALAAAQALTLPRCVGQDAIAIGVADSRSWLDAGDLATATAAMGERFPMLARDGPVPSQVLLWRRVGGEWIYVLLVDSPTTPGERCVAATVRGASLAVTGGLLRKYFPGVVEL